MNANKYSVEECDVFDLMAHHVGLSVLHPGGLWATERLAEKCKIDKNSKVLDIACGKGKSAIYLAQRHRCQITGIDIEENFIKQANELAQKKRLSELVRFQIGDALNLPFSDNQFDVTLSEAFLILIDNKKQAIREAIRVTKPGGFIGWLELSFKKPPPESLFHAAESRACVFCIRNALTFDKWKALFLECGMTDLEVVTGEMGMRQRQLRMFRDEGILNMFRIMRKWLFNTRIRKRMNAVFDFFRKHTDYIGFGIYVGRKSLYSIRSWCQRN